MECPSESADDQTCPTFTPFTMRFLIFSLCVAAALALPADLEQKEVVPILKKDFRVSSSEAGGYTLDVETGDGISRSEVGVSGANGAVEVAGQISFYLPDGTLYEQKFVSGPNGYQPISDFIPVGPAWPQWAIDQAAEQRARAEEEARENDF